MRRGAIATMTGTRAGVLVGAAALALSLSGCNVAIVAGIIVGVSSGSSSSHSTTITPTPPSVSSVSPASGSHGGGAAITITGAEFSADQTVAIGGIAATGVQFQDSRHITAVVPRSGKVGAADVTVTDPTTGSGTLSNGFTYTVGAPAVAIASIPSPQSGNVVVSFTVAQPESDLVDLAVELDAGSGFQAVPASRIPSGPTTAFASSPSGVPHTITLDVVGLLGATNAPRVQVRLTPTGQVGAAAGAAAVSNAFSLQNNAPPSVSIVQPATDAYDIVISFVVANAEPSDHVQLTGLRWNDLVAGTSGNMTVRSGTRPGPVGFSAAGTTASTVWDSLKDLGYGNNRLVTVSVSVSDGFSGATATTAPFFVNNGPIASQVTIPATILEGMAVADVTGDGKRDLVATNSGDDAFTNGTVTVNVNTGRSFAPPIARTVPTLPGTFPASPVDPKNPFFYAHAHTSECAALDVDGDGQIDFLAACNLYAPNVQSFTLANNVTTVLTFLGEDRDLVTPANSFAHVIEHQVSLRALQKSGALDVTNATYESTQAPVANLAPELFLAGSSQFTKATNGDPGHDNVGWLVQDMVAADLDGPATQGRGSTDLVIVEGIRDVSAALSGDVRGAVVIRQVDPTTKKLGPTWYLDPTDMGALPTHAAVADVLSSSRAGFGFTAPVGSPDIVVANVGDSSLTFYLQVAPASWVAGVYTPPTFTSVHFPLSNLNPAIPAGDTVAVALGDLNGDGANDLVVIGQLSKTAICFIWDPTGPIAAATGGLLPYRVGPVLQLPELLAGRPAIQDISSDGRADLLIPNQLANELLAYVNTGNDAAGNPVFTLVRFAAGFFDWGVVAVDLNGDGRPDVVVPNFQTAEFSVYYQVTPGTLYERFVPIPSGQGPLEVVAGDVTGDGVPELVVPCENSNDVYIYGRDPVQLLKRIQVIDASAPAAGVTASLPLGVVVAPLLGNPGRRDIGICSEIAVDVNGLGGGFSLVPGTPLGGKIKSFYKSSIQSIAISAGDLNNDRINDVVLATPTGNVISIFFGTGGGAYNPVPLQIPANSPRFSKVLDLDGDGFPDLVVACSDSIQIFWGSATGISAASNLIVSTASPAAVSDPVFLDVGDVNNDGLADVVVAGFVTFTGAGVVYQTSPRNFTVVPLTVGGQPNSVAIGSLSTTGLNDVAICWGSDNLVAVYQQDPNAPKGSTASLRAPVTYATGSLPFGCAIVDVTGDGKNDLVVAARGANSLDVFIQR